MKKRQFLSASAGAALAALAVPGSAAEKASDKAAGKTANLSGPALLTVTGAITHTNRRGFDAATDVMMSKQKLSFDKAYAFDFAALTKLPATTIKPVLEYDAKPHVLQGPLLVDVLQACGVTGEAERKILLRAVDGYAAAYTLSQVRKLGFIIATQMDGQSMPLGGLGPLWALFDAEKQPEYAAKPLAERFGGCPWAIYHIDVAAA